MLFLYKMLERCYSGFHWKLISGLMGLPALLVTSFIRLEFSLESSPGKKRRSGEQETRVVNVCLLGS